MQIYKEEISIRGKPVKVDAVRVDNKVIILQGNFIKTAKIKQEWNADVEDPESLIKALKNSELKADIFTFCQRLPETKPKFKYYTEMETAAAIPIKSFDHWWEKQISSQTRNKTRKAQKKEVTVRVAEYNDEFVKGIVDIFNESPVKRGKQFWHYGKDFDTVKKEWSTDLDKSDFIGAYYKDELIGYIKQLYTKKFAYICQFISKKNHLNKYPNNALIAKAVELCDKKQLPYLVYTGIWRSGSHGDFQRRVGFEKIDLPRYYIPLTRKGKIILKLQLHHGVVGILPEKLMNSLLDLRKQWTTKIIPKRS